MSDAKQARRYFISGSVQGVGFRYFAQNAAEKLHLSGFVCNLRDGRVEAFACGTAKQLDEFRAALERGPRFSKVQHIVEEPAEIDPGASRQFIITHQA
ncbi:MAG TPA: acylphosphatase [Candidatus Dormibacteraeota bacterium]|nr:acylphosphatase [Candidatus Dormibacteraeota bacterium]